jgi:toxin YoeB
MEIELTDEAKKDLTRHKRSGNKGNIKKIEQLLHAIADDPYNGIGQPEELKYDLSGKWSRRINLEHRLVYSVDNDIIYIQSLWGHY